jgi:protein-S-isoprenylcysteine O-methyltransferase Ste14
VKLWKPKRNLPLRIRRIAVIVFFFVAVPVPELLIAGAAAMVLGTLVHMLSYGMLLKRDELATRGPYAFCRHPAYLGMLISALGFCLATGWHLHALILSAAFVIITVPLYYRKIRFEEERLTELHGGAYRDYARRVRRKLIPSLISGLRHGGLTLSLSFEASIRNHSLKRASKDFFWFTTFVAKWYYFTDFHPLGAMRWSGRPHNWLLTAALLALVGVFLVFKFLGRRYRGSRKTPGEDEPLSPAAVEPAEH